MLFVVLLVLLLFVVVVFELPPPKLKTSLNQFPTSSNQPPTVSTASPNQLVTPSHASLIHPPTVSIASEHQLTTLFQVSLIQFPTASIPSLTQLETESTTFLNQFPIALPRSEIHEMKPLNASFNQPKKEPNNSLATPIAPPKLNSNASENSSTPEVDEPKPSKIKLNNQLIKSIIAFNIFIKGSKIAKNVAEKITTADAKGFKKLGNIVAKGISKTEDIARNTYKKISNGQAPRGMAIVVGGVAAAIGLCEILKRDNNEDGVKDIIQKSQNVYDKSAKNLDKISETASIAAELAQILA